MLIGHLALLKNRFGRCVGGTHPLLKEMCMAHDLRNARVNTIVSKVNIDDFYTIPWCTVQTEMRRVQVWKMLLGRQRLHHT